MRIYVITYTFYRGGGGGKYNSTPNPENRKEIFWKDERDLFIKRYLELKKSDNMYYEDIKCFYADTFIEITDMEKVINAI
jgi:hypothetical protein